ncbi:MAG: hypothetical protein JRE23_14415 [Deltaproteobacteria bacterium]|nr:hypothetical protein [Deltaproteobacteria bacterium]
MAYNKIDTRAVDMWNNLHSLQMIADELGVSRHGVKKYLNRHGIDTRKRKWEVVCHQCGEKFEKHRCQIRKNKFNYCSTACYHGNTRSPEYQVGRQDSRSARAAVRACGYYMIDGEAVYYKDGNTSNNDPSNLMVFANNDECMRWHRGDREVVKPLWPI